MKPPGIAPGGPAQQSAEAARHALTANTPGR
jgi:hypothetical protein